VPAVNAIPIRSDLSLTLAAMAEPLGCVIHASDAAARAQARYHLNGNSSGRHVESVLVCGAGPAGLMFVQYLRRVLGYDGLLLVSEPNPDKRKSVSETRGGHNRLIPGDRDAVEAVHDYTAGKGVSINLIEASAPDESWRSSRD